MQRKKNKKNKNKNRGGWGKQMDKNKDGGKQKDNK